MNSQHRETVDFNTKFGTITAFKENGIIRAKVFGMPVQKDFKNLFL
jgi:hypothetical protein